MKYIHKLLEIFSVPKVNQEETENLNRLITANEIKAVEKTNSLSKKTPKVLDWIASQVNFAIHFKN